MDRLGGRKQPISQRFSLSLSIFFFLSLSLPFLQQEIVVAPTHFSILVAKLGEAGFLNSSKQSLNESYITQQIGGWRMEAFDRPPINESLAAFKIKPPKKPPIRSGGTWWKWKGERRGWSLCRAWVEGKAVFVLAQKFARKAQASEKNFNYFIKREKWKRLLSDWNRRKSNVGLPCNMNGMGRKLNPLILKSCGCKW